jgi:hypothetical protein
MQIEPVGNDRHFIPTLAHWHFDYWGRLTGFETVDAYHAALERWSAGADIPTVLVAVDHKELVIAGSRGIGVGAALMAAAGPSSSASNTVARSEQSCSTTSAFSFHVPEGLRCIAARPGRAQCP